MGDSDAGVSDHQINQERTRGMFQRGFQYTLAACVDGTSNTIMFGEIATPSTGTLGAISLKEPRVQGVSVPVAPKTYDGLPMIDVNDCKATARSGKYIGTVAAQVRRGTHWLDALPLYCGFNTILAPNSPICFDTGANVNGEIDGTITSQSYHFGGAHVIMFDNSVKFIPNSIDTADNSVGASAATYYSPGRTNPGSGLTQTRNWVGPSPYGLWGAMGTKEAGESVGEMPGA